MECCIIVFGIVASLIRLGLTGITGGLTLVPCINSWVCSAGKIGCDLVICGGQSLFDLWLKFISMIMAGLQSVPCIVNYIEIAETAIGDLIAALGK